MVRLRELPRTATFAWSSGSGKPLLVTGTRAGAVDADFSDESKLELWDLSLDDPKQGIELQPIVSITTESSFLRFYDIAWGPPDSDHPRGIIAGALENGSLDLWDAETLISGEDALMSQTTKHSGPIKTIQFNPLKPQILATGGAKGELYIYDVNDIENPFRLGNTAARSDDIDCLAWNQKVSHILATGGAGGFVTVWDLKTKKASLTLNNSRKAVSAIAWDPNNSTKLLTATPDDNMPVIFLWDLRNSNAPEKTLQGHEQGILSLSWCAQDSDLLLSAGKDNRTIVWNPQTGERLGEFPEVTNWTFLTRFNPHNPNLSATASFDGKITIQTLQNTNPDTSQSAAGKNLDDEEFFSAAQTQPQGASWSLSKAPKWYERPVGVSFGFGGKVVVLKQAATQPGQKRSSQILITSFSADSEVSVSSEKFQSSLASGDLTAIFEDKIEQAGTEDEKADWKVMETLVGDNPRGKIVEYLGFTEDEVNGEDVTSKDTEKEDDAKPEAETEEENKKKRLSNFFDGADADGEGEDFLSNLAANKGAKTDKPFHLFADSDTSIEKDVTKALMLGNFAKATDICLKQDRIADAFLIANCGGQELVDKVQSAYLARKNGIPSYLRLIGSVITKNLWDVVYNADLENWKETMAILCTYSDPAEFPDLCEALGDRISQEGSRKDASFCYLVGSKLEKVVSIWAAELDEEKKAGISTESDDSTFSVHARTLQSFIEKVTVFRKVSKFTDGEKSLTSDWKLAALYDKYTEYADILAGQGQLLVAQQYLDLLPSSYPAAELARNRVRLATQKPGSQASTSKPAPRTSSRAGYQNPLVGAAANQFVGAAANQFVGVGRQSPAPPTQNQAYVPPGQAQAYPTTQTQPFASSNPYQPQGTFNQPSYPHTMAPPPVAPGPPRNLTPSSGPPPSKAKNMENWNDVPIVTKAPPRKSTPSVQAITSPFPNQPATFSAPPPPGAYGQRGVVSPPPPPPKAGPPRVQSPLTGSQSFQAPPRPSSAANQYAPPHQASPNPYQPPHAIPPTSYNAPPAAAPSSNRYAPSPAAQQAAHPPPASIPPPAGAYGVPPQQPPSNNPYAPSPYAPAPNQGPGAPQPGPPPQASRPGPPPSSAPAAATAPPKAAAPAKARHPAGDRSHIPANAQPLVEILSQDMQRVASKAPATFATHIKDTQKRLNILFDHLNNEELIQPSTIEQLSQLANALQSKDYPTAQKIQVDIQRDKTEECGNWMVGVKRLITMSKATN
ncbi:unnamed protein product [Clonostachys chloroleuca]|uniref:Protein transport protein SEC31 n=1 Tax=Clonostachys chloroleuca TaxID=1926264 RepID=A0AA35VPW7_9HYPO|nr:unnamed protein product [Clonostachys chloroleuca]